MSSNSINTDRILSLDVFRGLTMALMVLVNSLGTRHSYSILEHADWNGCSLADLVFPFFLFIVGMTTVISLKKHRNTESKAQLYGSIFKRTLILFLLGIFLNVFPNYIDLTKIRVYGILQRIAICYLICAVLYLHTSVKVQFYIFLGIIIGYWYFLTQIPMPGDGSDQLIVTRNWVGYIDKLIFSPKHFFGTFDPEGFLSTIPSIATTIAGLITGTFMISSFTKQYKCSAMFFVGFLMIIIAWFWSDSFPINKNLWTSTYVLWCGGLSLIVFGLCFYLIDILGYTKWSVPFKIFGMNALFIFVFHVLLLKIQSIFIMTLANGSRDNLRVFIADSLFAHYGEYNAGLFYALMFVFLNFLVAAFLYWRKIFIKI